MQSKDSDNTKRYPAHRLRIQSQPEESLVGSIDLSRIRIRRLKDPVTVTRLSVDFIPPAQTDQSSASNVLEVVEVHGQEDDCDDEDEDVVFAKVEAEEVGQETCCFEEETLGFVDFIGREAGVEELTQAETEEAEQSNGMRT